MKPRSFVLFVLAAACLLNAQSAPTLSQSPSDGTSDKQEETKALLACGQMVADQFAALKIPDARGLRFQGKVSEATAGAARKRFSFEEPRGSIGAIIGARAI
jgi:hypothetical protein